MGEAEDRALRGGMLLQAGLVPSPPTVWDWHLEFERGEPVEFESYAQHSYPVGDYIEVMDTAGNLLTFRWGAVRYVARKRKEAGT